MSSWLRAAALAAMAFACLLPREAKADGGAAQYRYVGTCDGTYGPLSASGPSTLTYDSHGQLCIVGGTGGGGGAAAVPFTPGGTYATLTATGSSASVALPIGTVVVFQNAGTTAVSCSLGVGSATATVSQNIIQPSSWIGFTVATNTFGACIDVTGSVSNLVVLSGGSNFPAGAGGGGGGAGGPPTGTAGAPAAAVVTVQGITSGTPQSVSAASLPLPAGAATEATLAGVQAVPGAALPGKLVGIGVNDGTGLLTSPKALSSGVAGTPASDFISVQGGPGMAPLVVTGASSTASGSYCISTASGLMGAGIAANSPILSFHYAGAGYALIRNVWISAQDNTTGFAAGTASFGLYVARSFTVADTAGVAVTLSGNAGKLRTSFPSTAVDSFRYSSTAALTAGTRTLDTQPLAILQQAVPTTIGYQLVGPYQSFFRADNIQAQPLQVATNEGFVIQATVPATGTWNVTTTTCWDEAPAY